MGSIQFQWLQTQMAASTANFKIVCCHLPPYSSQIGANGGFSHARWGFDTLGTDLVLSAHFGIYERLEVNGLPYIINGVGGNWLSTFEASPLSESQFRFADFGAMLVEINNDIMTLKFYDYSGVQKDSYTINKSLPVELTSFSASVTENGVKLKWETATEVDNYGFNIERKLDNPKLQENRWQIIGLVNGNGNSNSPKNYSFDDISVSSGKYKYRLKQIDNDGQFEYSNEIEVDLGVSRNYTLSQNYPNPFNPVSTIDYSLPNDAIVSLKVYDIMGREVSTIVNEQKQQGKYSIEFNGEGLTSGIYFYVLQADNITLTKKMNLLK